MDRILTPQGLKLYTSQEYAALAQKNQAPDDAAIIKDFIAEVETVKATKNSKRKYRFTISTDGVDRDNDVIKMDGMDLGNYRKNPVVFYAHDYRSLPIGTSNIKTGKHNMEADLEFVGADLYPFAETVRQFVDAGVIRCASVGFKPKKADWVDERKGLDIHQAELLEWSVVPVPANADCLVQLSTLPKGVVDQFAESCEQMLTACKGKGMWVVGVDLKQMQDFAQAFNTIDVAKLVQLVSRKEDVGYAGCTRNGGCPTNHDGSPENCTMADCPMKASGQVGADADGAGEDILAGVEVPDYTNDIACSFDDVDKIVSKILRDSVAGPIREAVRSQINYACGRVD